LFVHIFGFSKNTVQSISLETIFRALDFGHRVPDLFFNNEKKANIHHVTVPNMLMHIYPDGDVVYSMRYVLIIDALTGLIPPHYSACPTPEPGFLTSYVVIIFILC